MKLPEKVLNDGTISVTLVASGDFGRLEISHRDHKLDSNGVAKIRELAPDRTERIYIQVRKAEVLSEIICFDDLLL